MPGQKFHHSLKDSGEASQKFLVMLRAVKARGFLEGSGGMTPQDKFQN
jgi:hypothetical protein